MKIDVALMGATGAVGQKFIQLLREHPFFRLKELYASERSAGKTYGEAVKWKLSVPLDPETAALPVLSCHGEPKTRLVFSALDASAAGPIESRLVNLGHLVISNARNHRMDHDVPIMIPEINGSFLNTIRADKGALVTNPNCSTAGLALSLFPLYRAFGLQSVHAVTMQAFSGAGYPGLSAWDIFGNVIPFIEGEEEKIEQELPKIFGRYNGNAYESAPLRVTASCNRVPVRDGHLIDISATFDDNITMEEIREAWALFRPNQAGPLLPSAPSAPVIYRSEVDMPQPSLFHEKNSMSVYTGRLKALSEKEVCFKALVHNTVRGAAGNALLIAEHAVSEKLA
jgi:aspartate-semialdehyde dehydrogenase